MRNIKTILFNIHEKHICEIARTMVVISSSILTWTLVITAKDRL